MKTALQTHHRTIARRPLLRGVTLVESAITLAVVATITSAVAPGFSQARERRQMEGVAAQFATDVHYARSLAVARATSVRISFSSGNGASCYVVHTGSAGACSCDAGGAAVCTGTAQALHAVRLGASTGPQLAANVGSMVFDGTKGTVTPTATVRILGSTAAIHEIVNIMGRVRACSPAPTLPGYKAC